MIPSSCCFNFWNCHISHTYCCLSRAGPLAQGTHAFSKDGLSWEYSSVTTYSGVIDEVGGGQTVWNRRERPHILTADNVSLLALTTGVGNAVDGWTIGEDYTWTHVQPIRVR